MLLVTIFTDTDDYGTVSRTILVDFDVSTYSACRLIVRVPGTIVLVHILVTQISSEITKECYKYNQDLDLLNITAILRIVIAKNKTITYNKNNN